MNVKVIGNKIFLNAVLKNNETYKISEKQGIFSLVIFNKPQKVRGVTSLCQDMKHILMLDWDNVCKWIVEKELNILSEVCCSPLYLFKTKEEKIDGELVGNYHAISLEKFTANEVVDIQRKTSCDNAYTTMPLRNRYRSWVLRLSDKKGSGKPKFVGTIGGLVSSREISGAHLSFLNKIYKLPKIEYDFIDNFKKVFINEYETR